MKLEPPIEKYTKSANPSHCSLKKLPSYITGYSEEKLETLFIKNGYLSGSGKVTAKALSSGLVDTCDNKILWNINAIRKYLSDNDKSRSSSNKTISTEEKWVDLDVVGTYFSVGKVTIGKWLDQLGLRVKQELKENEGGGYDMLDVARQAQEEQANGFIAKKPSDKALEKGLARYLTVTNRKQKEIEITQWNLELCKQVLVKAGHPLKIDEKAALKGKGKNSNVKVKTIDDRAQELYVEWGKLYRDSNNRWKIKTLFKGQPTAVLLKVEKLMQMPGYIIDGKYLKEL